VESRPCGNRYVSSSSDNCTVSAASIAAGLPALSFAVQQNGPRLQLPLAALLLPGIHVRSYFNSYFEVTANEFICRSKVMCVCVCAYAYVSTPQQHLKLLDAQSFLQSVFSSVRHTQLLSTVA
jgi:hypothetical protein